MLKLLPIFSIIFNFVFFMGLEKTISTLIPDTLLPFSSLIRTLILFLVVIFFLYTPLGQRAVAFFVSGRNTIGREEQVIEPIIEQLKDRTDIRGYSAPVWFQLQILNALNNITGKKIRPLDRRVNRIKYEYMTGTVKIFTFDTLDIESNSFGNSIFLSKGAVDTLTKGELTALIYNEFAQIKYNIANKRLLHDAGILIGRLSAILVLILAPFALAINFFKTFGRMDDSFSIILGSFFLALLRVVIMIVLKALQINFTQLPYMFYERKIFVDADRATHKAGFSGDMNSYLEKLYYFKLNKKNLSKLFVELRPLVAYRMNYFDNLLGKNSNLSADNYAWSSNYMHRVQTINNHKM